jgi:hypothetical protein
MSIAPASRTLFPLTSFSLRILSTNWIQAVLRVGQLFQNKTSHGYGFVLIAFVDERKLICFVLHAEKI